MILHNIRSLHNVGSIFRTADAVGVEKIYLCGITPAPLDRFGCARKQLIKVSLGAEKTVPWEYSRSAVSVIRKLKKDGYKIFVVEQNAKSIPYYKVKVRSSGLRKSQRTYEVPRVALVLGNEVSGLSPHILKLADKILEIPMLGRKESLNVAVAFGIVAYGI
ncbi:MAG: TrmH family RNA methyltransferase [Candidatus Liptonbacteria bacterium]|nr:TrmH family RNA methyltransferase [Candidatus Liptonbacteria bacterium]